MAKKMLFNATEPEEIRAAIVEDRQLIEYDIETRTREQNRNNIYRGYIVQVEPSIQAAFVEYGTNRHGFLPFREIHPDFWSRQPKNNEPQPSIEKVIKKGQQVVVQVVREEVDHKGAALTTYCTLPGRYLVLMTRSENCGISRKIENQKERQSLRKIMNNLNPPAGFGYIIRTAGLGKTESEISRDLDIMVRLWKSIEQAAKRSSKSGLIFQDADIIQRMLRDYHEKDIEEIWLDDRDSYERANTYFSAVMPNMDNVVKYYDKPTPLFSEHSIEQQVLNLYERKVPLPSGGSIVIDPTEALVAIDVNSGKTQSDKTEDTAYKTNCEAAVEIARQLRLRDLGGLIVIDFIGMRMARHMRGVERALREAMKSDKARIRLGRITSIFGLLTLSRQRIRDNKDLAHFVTCPTCRGMGRYPNVETNALIALRHLNQLAMQEQYDRINAALPKEVSYYLLNYKRDKLFAIEDEYDVKITISPKDGMTMDLERDISVQIRRKERKKKEKDPVQLPFEKLSSQEAPESPKQADDNTRVTHVTRDAPVSLPVPDDADEPLLIPVETYIEEGWDQIAHERAECAQPEGSPWFLQYLTPNNNAPSRVAIAKQYNLPTDIPRVATPQPTTNKRHTRNGQTSHARPAKKDDAPKADTSGQETRETKRDTTREPRKPRPTPPKPTEATNQRRGRAPETTEQPTEVNGNVREEESSSRHSRDRNDRSRGRDRNSRSRDRDRSDRNSRSRDRDRSDRNSRSRDRYNSRDRDNTRDRDRNDRSDRNRSRERDRDDRSRRNEQRAQTPKDDPRSQQNTHSTGLETFARMSAQQSTPQPAPQAPKQPVTNEEAPTPRPTRGTPLPPAFAPRKSIPSRRDVRSNPTVQVRRPSGAPGPHIPSYNNPNRPKISNTGGSLWSPEEFARIREAAEVEERKRALWQRASGEGGAPPPAPEPKPEPAPEPKVQVLVAPPDQQEEEAAKTVLKRTAPKPAPAEKKAEKKAASKPQPKEDNKNGSAKRSRWSNEELELLASLCHLPLLEAKKAFEDKGYSRSLNAFRNRYYNLRSDQAS